MKSGFSIRHWCAPLVIASALLLSACQPAAAPFQSVDITGADYAHDFDLLDATGAHKRLADYRGKAVVLFFGYTQCPDICPTTMSDLAQVMKQLGAEAGRVQVLFVTLDPERDKPSLLQSYVPAFDPRFVGLYGDEAATTRTAKEFKVFYQRVPGSRPDSYSLDHSAGLYVFDPEGHIRLFVRPGQSADSIAQDLKRLLA